jgi:hypothetical protein
MSRRSSHQRTASPQWDPLEARLLLSASDSAAALVGAEPADPAAVESSLSAAPDTGGLDFDGLAEAPAAAEIDADPPTIDAWYSAAQHGSGVGQVLLEIPDDGSFSDPRIHAVVTRLLIAFSEPIDPESFTRDSVRIAGRDAKGLPVDLSETAISTRTDEADTVGIIHFCPVLPDVARYLVGIEGVTDAAGNPLAGDSDRVFTALEGDANGDLRVNAIDLSYIWARRTNEIDGVSPEQARADVTGDGRVNAIDLSAAWARRGSDMRGVSDPELPDLSGEAAAPLPPPGAGLAEPSAASGTSAAGFAGPLTPAAIDPAGGGSILPALPPPAEPMDALVAAPGEAQAPDAETSSCDAAALDAGLVDVLEAARPVILLGG